MSYELARERYPLLSRIGTPRDLRSLTSVELVDLAAEIRRFLIASVSRTGGHLGPNLGVVELTIAIHRVFDSPHDTIVWDTGHQSYVHKLLTGRHDFRRLRRAGGLSGYPSRAESVHDVVEDSHASTSLSWADGISREYERQGSSAAVVAVIGDGALTGGMAWEALNNVAASAHRSLVIVVNDNGRSYAPTVGALARQLDALRTSEQYERTLAWGKRTLLALGQPGRAAYEALHGLKAGVKDLLAPQMMFEDLGIKYLGPIDGHDEVAVEYALTRARDYRRPVMVHVLTQKGRGYEPAERDSADRFHTVGAIHPETGLPIAPERFGWTMVFADEILRIARENPRVVGITAAMMRPVGLEPFHAEFPGRVVDVGIAEQHAVTSAAGMAFAGAHPVVAVYATFLNRAFDQVLMDVGLHRAGVTFALDRAGITGADGPSHNGMWDIPMLSMVPGMRIAAPRDESTLRLALNEAVEVDDGPTAIRYPKGALPEPLPALRREGGVDVLDEPADPGTSARVSGPCALIVGVGPLAREGVEASRRLRAVGVRASAVDPRWIVPVPAALVALARRFDVVVTAEDGLVQGGFGWALRDALAEAGTPVVALGIPRRYLAQGDRHDMLAALGLDARGIARAARGALARRAQRI